MATEKDLKRQGLWDYERDQPLRRNRPVPDETMDRSKPELPTSKTEGLVTRDYAEARAAAAQAEKMLQLNHVDVAALMRDAYQLGFVDGLRAERKRPASETPAALHVHVWNDHVPGVEDYCTKCGFRPNPHESSEKTSGSGETP